MEKVEYSVVSGDVIISGRYVKHKFADPVQVRRGGNGVTRVGNSATNVHCRHAGWSQWEGEAPGATVMGYLCCCTAVTTVLRCF